MRVHKILFALAVLIITQSLSVHGQWLPGATSGSIYYNSGNVGIGTTAPNTLLHVGGDITAGPSSGGYHLVVNDIATARWALGTGNFAFHIANDYPSASTWVDRMYISRDGNVGIGTVNPLTKLDINTTESLDGLRITHNNNGFVTLRSTSLGQAAYNNITQAGDGGIIYGATGSIGTGNFGFVIAPWANAESGMRIDKNGNVGIGTANTNDAAYKLFVETGIRTRKIKVDHSSWPDYIFHTTYQLRPLNEVEQYIQQNRHLPEVPSAEEVTKNGLDLGDNQATLLKKIEELTLYVIEQNKKLEQQNELIKKQQDRLEALEKRIKE